MKKHTEILTQLRDIVQKEASVQDSITGDIRKDLKPHSVTQTPIDKNKVRTEDNESGISHGESPTSSAAATLLAQIKDAIDKMSGDEVPETITQKTTLVDKNKVRTEDNETECSHGPSAKKKKVKSEGESEENAGEEGGKKESAYNLGVKFASLIADAVGGKLDKTAGARDFDKLIEQAAKDLNIADQEKVAEVLGAACFFEKQAEDQNLEKQAEALGYAIGQEEIMVKQAEELGAQFYVEEQLEKAAELAGAEAAGEDYAELLMAKEAEAAYYEKQAEEAGAMAAIEDAKHAAEQYEEAQGAALFQQMAAEKQAAEEAAYAYSQQLAQTQAELSQYHNVFAQKQAEAEKGQLVEQIVGSLLSRLQTTPVA